MGHPAKSAEEYPFGSVYLKMRKHAGAKARELEVAERHD
jgi:hypothetical protein